MKRQLSSVTIDNDVHGPGPKRMALHTTTFARERMGAAGQLITTLIEHDVECQVLRLRVEGVEERPVVEIPWSRVRYCEPLEETHEPSEDASHAAGPARTHPGTASPQKPRQRGGQQRHQGPGHDPGSPEVA